jgi:1-deoxy-D-xylulose-5-phosphate reductoisomerase
MVQLADSADYDLLVNAVVGTHWNRRRDRSARGIPVHWPQREPWSCGGELVSAAMQAHHRAAILPIDSEHTRRVSVSAGETERSVEAVCCTGSGGPFRTLRERGVRFHYPGPGAQASELVHGPKITIDSATMMNKGLEVIEAHWLFSSGR